MQVRERVEGGDLSQLETGLSSLSLCQRCRQEDWRVTATPLASLSGNHSTPVTNTTGRSSLIGLNDVIRPGGL